MQSVSRIIGIRRKHLSGEGRNPVKRLGLGCSILFSLFTVLAVLVVVSLYINLTHDLPSLDTLPQYLEPPDGLYLQPTRLYDRSGEKIILSLENPAAVGRQYLRVDMGGLGGDDVFSETLLKTTISAVDPTFWSNPGYTWKGLVEGTHSTIAQRLVSDLLLWGEIPGLRRNMRERLLAAQVTIYFGREKVLEWYLNSARYGDLVYGADAAARVYLDKGATNLSLGEAALLAAIGEAPAINPLETPQVVLERQQQIILSALFQGLIDSEQADRASREVIDFRETVRVSNPAPAFTNLVLEQLATQFPLERLERGGLRVLTTLDYDLQVQADCATSAHVSRLEGMQTEISTFDGGDCEASRFLATIQLVDSESMVGLAAGVIVLDPHSGQVLAMVGGLTSGQDPARLSGHSSGSILTPLIYLTAFTRGLSPASLIWDVPDIALPGEFPAEEGALAGYPDEIFRGPMRLRSALASDDITAAGKVLEWVGGENVWRTVKQFGIMSLNNLYDGSLAAEGIFTGEITLMEVAQAFGVLANQGILAGQSLDSILTSGEVQIPVPSVVIGLEETDGRVWLDWSVPQGQSIVSPQLTYLVTHILSDETSRWPTLGHPNPLEIGRSAAAKIGRTEEGTSTWTVGYIPQLVVGVWVGYPGEGDVRMHADVPATLWHAIIQYAAHGLPVQEWNVPPGISQVEVCDPSGMLPTVNCPAVVTEVFLTGSEPTQSDNLYQTFLINRETGRLATVFTPPELVEERVYLVVPPHASEWARNADLPTPPDTYDVIFTPPPALPEVQFTRPQMFDHVSGDVSFWGSAGGDDFSYYRIQVGQGLNPQEWIQVGEDSFTPVEDGLLGVWEAGDLNGLYAVRLLVVRRDQRVDTFVLQVTVDNQAPEVLILNPAEGQMVPFRRDMSLILHASANDDLELAKVDFYMDDRLVATMMQEPYTISWQLKLGTHTLTVRASDLAGNETETMVNFTVE